MGDYVGDMTQQAKLKPIAPVGASRQMGEISLSRGFYFFSVLYATQNVIHSYITERMIFKTSQVH